jgi:hypothetical protein
MQEPKNLKPTFTDLLKQKATEANKGLADKSIIVDPTKVEEIAAPKSTEYGGIEKHYQSLPGDYYDAYEDYINPHTLKGRNLSMKEMQEMRFENQGIGEQLGNTAKRIGTNIVPQIVAGVSSMIDIPGYWDAEHAANNNIVKWADQLQKESNQNWFPIYTNPADDTMDLGSASWWLDRGSGLVTSVGAFLAQGFGVGKAVSLGTKGLSYALQGKNLLNTVIGAEKVAKGVGALGTLTEAIMLNQSEAVIEATQVYEDTFNNAINANVNPEEAKKKAANAAATTMNLNRINILFNLSSAGMFVDPLTGATRNLLKAPKSILGHIAKEAPQEAIEEIINHVASKAGMARGEGKAYTFENALKDAGSAEGMEAAFLGAIGGIAQTGGTEILRSTKFGPGSTTDENGNRISGRTAEKADYARQQEIINQMKEDGVDINKTVQNFKDQIIHYSKIQNAAAAGNTEEVERLKNEMFENQALKAFQSGTTEVLENLYKAEAAKDPNVVSQEYVDRANKAVENLKVLEEVYNNNQGYNNVSDIFYNRANRIKLQQEFAETDAAQKQSNIDLGLVVRNVAKEFNFEHEKEYIDKENGEEVSRGTRKITSPLTYSMNDLEENPGTTEHNRKVYDQFLNKLKETPQYKAAEAAKTRFDQLEKLVTDNDIEYSNLTSPEAQAKAAEEKAIKEKTAELTKALNNPNIKISDVEKLMQETTDPEFRKIAEKKIEELKTANAAAAKQNKVNTIIQQAKNIIDNTPLEGLDALSQEIEQMELSEDDKEILRKAVSVRMQKLENPDAEVEEETGIPPVFSQGQNPEELAQKEEESFETELPKDLPNPNTEAQSVEEGVAQNAKALLNQDSTTVEGQDAQGNLIYNYDRSSEGYNRGAFLSREFNQKDNEGVIDREEFTNKVEDNLDILDPDKYLEGEELTLDVDLNYTGEKYDPKSTTRETISWENRLIELNQLAKERGVNLTQLPEYIAEVPIVVKAKDGTPIFYVHDNSWYKEENLNASPEEIAEDKARNYKIRETIVKKGVTKSKISYKSYGRLFKTAKGEKLSLDEAMPDPNLVIAVGKNGTFDGNVDLPIETINGKAVAPRVLGTAPIQEGRPYALVRVGQGVYMPIPVQRSPISPEVVDTIMFAIEAYLTDDPDNQTVKNIYNATGYNIHDITGLRGYISQFIYLFPTKGAEGLENTLIQGGQGGKLKSNMPLIAITGNSIEFGKPGVNMGIKKNEKAGSITRNPLFTATNIKALAKLREVILNSGKVLSSVSINDLKLNKNTALILNAEGDTTTSKYYDHVKKSTETNNLSINIGTEQEPKWVYTIQPTVLFDTSFAGIDSTQKLRAFKPIEKTIPTVEQEVETSTEETLIDTAAKELLQSVGITAEALSTFLDGIKAEEGNEERIPDEALTQSGFESREQAAAILSRAIEMFRQNASETKTITLPNGQKITIDKDTQDSTDLKDDEEDYSLPALETPVEGEDGKTYLDKINEEIEDLVVRGIDPSTQESLLTYLAADIMQQAIDAKEVNGKKSVDTAPIFEKHLESLKTLAKFYKENGLPNKAKRLNAIIDQFDKVKRLTNQKISLFTTGTVQEDLNLNDNESSVGLEKVVYSDDWAFTVSSKSTSSADLKRFFAFVQAQDENGPITNMLGFPEIMSYDTVYDTLHEILANKPADFDFMMETLELYKEKFPWLASVTEKLKNASDKIKNEFVSDMAKHHINMEFVMWSKDKNGRYSLQRWSSNASAIEQRLRQVWSSNLRSVTGVSNAVAVDENGDYVFSKAEVKRLVDQAAEFAVNPKEVTNDDLAYWLGALGIVITDDTYQDLRDGKFNNRGKKSWEKLFTDSDGLIRTLAKELKAFSDSDILVDDAELLNDSVVKALAKLDAGNNLNTFSNSFQAGGKTVYSYGNNNFLVNRMRDLIAYNEVEKQFINPGLIDGLKSVSFTKSSLWLNELTAQDALGDFTRNTLNVGYLSLEALKKKYTKSQDNRKLNNLTPAEHEVTKIGLFQNASGKILNGQTRRSVNFFYSTMSDKTTMLTLRALAYELKLENGEISEDNLKLLYTAMVEPELNRIRDKQASNIKGYEPNYFYFLPGLNTLPVVINNVEKTYLDLAKDKDSAIYSEEAQEAVMGYIKEVFNTLVTNKLADWKSLNIGQTIKDSKGKIIEQHSFLDKEYMSKVASNKVEYAAMDYVFNYLISNAEATKLFAGDPALYAKFNPTLSLDENLKESFTNMGKRLAGDIAPGLELANSTGNNYFQVFLADKKLDSNNLKDTVQKEFFSKIIDTYGEDYGEIEGSDAQEYTTWKEHLFVMKRLGRLTDRQFDIISKKLTSQTLDGPTRANRLSYDEMQTVLQPLKPVYVGNSLSSDDNVDKRVYIKSSSFPLIPELTVGFQIDKVRQGLEKFEESQKGKSSPNGDPLFVRASFGTANKVGAVKNPIKVFDDNGNVVDNFEIKEENTLIVERKNFRIQQDVPYKREKENINIGTQERKLIFSDLLDLQIAPGVTGQDLYDSYIQDYQDLFEYNQEKLAKRLGLIEEISESEDLSPLTVIPETNLVSEVETFNEELKGTKSPVAKIQKQEEFADKVGKDNLERINFINKNFDNIIEALAEGKVNIFFDENDQFKKCD